MNWKRPFFILWTGQAFSLLGSQLVQFALVWWLARTTDSASVLAYATLVALLPNIFLNPVAGALVDRWNCRVVILVSDAGSALATLILLVLFAASEAHVWQVYIVLLIRAAGGVFHFPAMRASTSLMVPADQLSRVQGLQSMLTGGMTIVAPPLGALLIESLSIQAVLMVDIITAAVGVSALLLVQVPQPARMLQKQSVWRDMRAGFDYARGWPGLLILLVMSVLINFWLVPASALLPLLAKHEFGGGATEYGWMESAFGIGVVVGGLILSVWGGFRRKVVTAQVGLIGIGVAHIALGVAPDLAAGNGGARTVWRGDHAVVQQRDFRGLTGGGRAGDAGTSFCPVGSVSAAMSPLSLAAAGPLADHFGVRFWYVIAGVMCVIMGSAALLIPLY